MDSINRNDIYLRHIIAEKLKTNDGYTWTLASRLGEILHIAEQRFGTRDKEYTILGIEFVLLERPKIWYPGNRKHIVIQLTTKSLYNESQALYQLAHEAIHLLSPTGGRNANILEEGLAAHFSDYYLEKIDKPKLIHDIDYQKAMELTNDLLLIDNDIIKQVRKIEPTISKLEPEHFQQIKDGLPEKLLSKLCKKFSQ
jgi:hypothetical protein